MRDADIDALHRTAYETFDAADLAGAVAHFERLLAVAPDDDADRPSYHYMAGLACKYLGRWRESLAHNLASLSLRAEDDEASAWNAGIAATALGDWAVARHAWSRAGVQVPGSEGPIDGRFGMCSVRLNPSNDGETLFAERFDVVRARIANVPLPESGFGFADEVLHDGASTGRRTYRGHEVPVFNVLERLRRSEFRTFAAFVQAPTPEDGIALESLTGPGVALVQDWTRTVATLCLRCSFGLPHEHERATEGADVPMWKTARSIGIAATHERAAGALLDRWQAGGRGRAVEHMEAADHRVAPHRYDHCWWDSPEPETPG